jgi:hypothetical protein
MRTSRNHWTVCRFHLICCFFSRSFGDDLVHRRPGKSGRDPKSITVTLAVVGHRASISFQVADGIEQRGSHGTAQRWATRQRQIQPIVKQPQRPATWIPRPRQAAWWLQCEASALTAEQQAFVRSSNAVPRWLKQRNSRASLPISCGDVKPTS